MTFSSAELAWLAGVLGKMNLFLPGKSGSSATLPDIVAGQAALVARGLIHRDDDVTWTVDRLAIVLIEWITAPDLIYSISSCDKDGGSDSFCVYLLRSQALLLKLKDGQYSFEIMRDGGSYVETILDFIRIPKAGSSAQMAKADLPDPWSLLPVIWQSSEIGERVLKESGADLEAIPVILKWAGRLQRMIEIGRWIIRDGSYNRTDGLMLVQNESHLWWMGIQPPSGNWIEFTTGQREQVQAWVGPEPSTIFR